MIILTTKGMRNKLMETTSLSLSAALSLSLPLSLSLSPVCLGSCCRHRGRHRAPLEYENKKTEKISSPTQTINNPLSSMEREGGRERQRERETERETEREMFKESATSLKDRLHFFIQTQHIPQTHPTQTQTHIKSLCTIIQLYMDKVIVPIFQR